MPGTPTVIFADLKEASNDKVSIPKEKRQDFLENMVDR